MQISVAVKRNIYAIAIVEDGYIRAKETKTLPVFDKKASVLDNLLYALKQGMNKLKVYIDEHPDTEDVVVEFNNSTVKKWLDSSYATPIYNDSFHELIALMDIIPVKYFYSVVDKPQAVHFLDKRYIKKPTVSGFDALGFEEADE